MERLQRCEINKLIPGDRFYIAGDSKKTVYQKILHDPKKTYFYTYTNFATRPESNLSLKIYIFKKETLVIFLRNINEKPKQNLQHDSL